MKLLSFFTASLAATAFARPFRRQTDPTDLLVLNFAFVLENLETEFYKQALAKFQDSDFTAAGFSNVNIPKELFSTILADESAHTSILETTIKQSGGQPITTCQFDFTDALKDVTTMAATARAVELVGVSAYMGAAPLMVNKELLTAAASILTIEGRHQSLMNVLNGASAFGQAFDMSLSPSQVLALVTPFVSGCDVGVPANPTLSVTASPAVAPDALLTFTSPGLEGLDPNTLFCQMMVGGASVAISLPLSKCIVPKGINGPVYIFITDKDIPLANSPTQNTAIIKAGPALVFLDTVPETLGKVVRNAPSVVTSTETISPGEASSIAAGAEPTTTAEPTDTATASSYEVTPTSLSGPNKYTGPSRDGSIDVIGWVSEPYRR